MYVDKEKEFIFSLLAKSIDKFYIDLQEDTKYEIEKYQREDFKEFIERDIPHIVKKRTELWMASHLNGVDRVLTQLESKLSEALSRYFNKKVFINTVSEELSISPCIHMTAKDISSVGVEAGVMTAAGAIALTMMGGSVFMPIVSMAVFPMLRQKMLKSNLDREKEEILPKIGMELRKYIDTLQMEIENNIEKRIYEIKICVKNNYERFIKGYILNMEKCLEDKQCETKRIENRVKIKENNYNSISMMIEKISCL
jgi:hypothetical protein